MRNWLVTAVLLLVCLPVAPQSGPQRPPAPSIPTVMPATGSITVFVEDYQGAPMATSPNVSIATARPSGELMEFPSQQDNQWVFGNLVPGTQYVVTAEAPGFQPSQQFVNLPEVPGASAQIEFFLVPSDRRNAFGAPAGDVVLAPRAQEEVQQAIKDLAANKFDTAQKHLGKALRMAPGDPLVNYLMGASWLREDDAGHAAPYLEKAVSLDPRQTPALLALGTVRLRQGQPEKAIDLLNQAVERAPDSWQAHWLLAAALLRVGNYAQARNYAESALKYGKEKAEPAKLIRGEALAKLGRRDEALKSFDDYLQRNPNDPRADQIRKVIRELRQPAAAVAEAPAAHPPAPMAVTAPPLVAPAPATAPAAMAPPPAAPPVSLPAKQPWAPADVDAEKLIAISGATCHLPEILKEAGAHAVELVTDLEKFSATEDYQAVEIGRNGQLHRPFEQKFSYLVIIGKIGPHLIATSELRTPAPASPLGGEALTGSGLPALALVFHPDFAGDFGWECEGMGEWNGQPAWMIHFRQRADRPASRLHAFVTPKDEYQLALKGRAWVAANGNYLLHLETDLVNPSKEVRLEREHFAIDYGPVKFHTQQVTLWLPETVDAYLRFRGHSYHQYSHFRNFELFWVGTEQKISEPKDTTPRP
ncbi:MAG TPA: tetratricopeptide repeat protein [Candidatus Acidoferrales bacterium]|nr:tetratricopeptide repeat protein [Candidatus Acidoferrales bacterium]